MTIPPTPNRPQHARASSSPGDWLQRHAKALGIGAIVVAATAGGVYMYQKMSATTAQRAERQLAGVIARPIYEAFRVLLDRGASSFSGTGHQV